MFKVNNKDTRSYISITPENIKKPIFWSFQRLRKKNSGINWFNPIHANVLFLYPLKTSENQSFSDVFRGYRNVTLALNLQQQLKENQ